MDLSQQFAMLSPEQQKLFYLGPAMNPPPGVISNFDNPPNQNALAYGIVTTSAVLSTIAIATRLYPRLFMGKRITLRLEDYLAMAAWAIFGPWLYYSWGLITSAGIYVHQWNVRYIDFVEFLYKLLNGSTIYGVVVGITKTAILLDWLHIFVPQRTRNKMAWIIYLVITLNCAYYTAGVLVYIFPCAPRKRFWDQTTPGTCINAHAASVAAGVVNMVSDFIMLAIPQKVIWGLHLRGSRKAGISSLFAIGIFACVCAVARLTYSIKLLINHEDMTYVMSPVGLWTVGEMTSGFLLLGIPSLPRIFKEVTWTQSVFTRIRSWTRSSSKGTHGSSAKGLPSWYKVTPTSRKRNDLYSDLDEHGLVEVDPPPKGIIRGRTVELRS